MGMKHKRWIWALPLILILAIPALSYTEQEPPARQPAQRQPVQTETIQTAPMETTAEETTAEDTVKAYAQTHNLPYSAWPRSLVALLERNPETEEFVLRYPELHDQAQEVDLSEYENSDSVPLFLQWDTRWGYLLYGSDVAGITGCGPVCLSMVAFYLTGDPAMSPDNLIRFALEEGYCVPGNGSAWTLISQGGEALGLEVTELPLVESLVFENLEAGNPIICIMGPGDFTDSGHYIVLAGCQDGKLRINDPNSREKSERLWEFAQIEDQIDNLWVLRRGD